MKKFSLFICFLFIFLFGCCKVNALTGSWADKIVWSDGTTGTGTTFTLWGSNNFSSQVTQNGIVWFNHTNDPYGFTTHLVVRDKNLFVDSVVKASVYFITNYPFTEGKRPYYTTYDNQNDFVTVTKVASGITFRGNTGLGNVYKVTYSFKVQDCIDSEVAGVYQCYADGYNRIFFFGSVYADDTMSYAFQLYGYGEVSYSDIAWAQPSSSDDKDLTTSQSMSVWDTIKSLPGKLLSWFSDLPSKIWGFISSGFTSLTDWFSTTFDNLGVWFSNLYNNIGDGFSNLGSTIGNFFTNLWNSINSGLQYLFIPKTNYFDDWYSGVNVTLKNKLGAVYQSSDIISNVFGYFNDLDNGSGIIHIPDIHEPFTGGVLINSQDFDIGSTFNTGSIGTLHDFFLYFMDAVNIILLINYAIDIYQRTIGGANT